MTTPAGLIRRAIALLVTAVIAGCGVQPEDVPDVVVTAAPRSPVVDGESGTAGTRLTVYFVQAADLTPVERRAARASVSDALALLAEGPSRTEAATGVRTALAPEPVRGELDIASGVVTVTVSRGFTGIAGADQLLALAQVVWTLTELPEVTALRFAVAGRAIEVPTDDGLSDRPVARDDYRSVAPAAPAQSTPADADEDGEEAAPTASPPPR